MYRTDKVRQVPVLVILALLAVCLSALFVLRDFTPLTGQPDRTTSTERFDDMQQDEPFLFVILAALFQAHQSESVLPSLLLPHAQIVFPLLHPPKI